MNARRITETVDRAIALNREIEEKGKELKALKDALTAEAEGRPDELAPGQGGGQCITFAGSDGCIARVSFPQPTLKSSIKGEGKAIDAIRDVAGKMFPRLFEQTPAYKPVAEFRDAARELLPARDAAKLTRLCTSETPPRVSFETAERTEPEA